VLEDQGRDLSASIATCSRARDLLALLVGRDAAVPDRDVLQSAWARVVATTGLAATHDIVELIGRPTRVSLLTWNDFKRRGTWSVGAQRAAWCAPRAMTSNSVFGNSDMWIGERGEVWSVDTTETLGFSPGAGPKMCLYVLGRGQRVQLKSGHAPYETFYTVLGGVHVSRCAPAPDIYAHVVTLALKHAL
jgi:hypothetical protein